MIWERAMKKILVVEDDVQIGESIRMLLENNGYHAKHVSQSEEVMQEFQMFLPDIILLDVDLGGVYDRYTLCGMIRQISDVPVIFLTAKSDTIDEVQAFNVGGDDFINKPYHPSVLDSFHIKYLKKREKVDILILLDKMSHIDKDKKKKCFAEHFFFILFVVLQRSLIIFFITTNCN